MPANRTKFKTTSLLYYDFFRAPLAQLVRAADS
jgi:hypothetical protein